MLCYITDMSQWWRQEGHQAEIAPAHQNSPTLHPPRSSRRNEGMHDVIRPLIWFVLKLQLLFPYNMHPLSMFAMCGDVKNCCFVSY